MTIWTVGHSNRSIEQFITILQSFNIELLADIRTMPGSKKWPQFNQHAFSRSLADAGIAYQHIPALGGKLKGISYTDYMLTEQFKIGIATLTEIALAKHTAYMCAETDWRRCHRSKVSEHLFQNNWQVIHIADEGIYEYHKPQQPKPKQGSLF